METIIFKSYDGKFVNLLKSDFNHVQEYKNFKR